MGIMFSCLLSCLQKNKNPLSPVTPAIDSNKNHVSSSLRIIDTTNNNNIDTAVWTELDHLNKNTEYPFITEDSITGIGVVTPANNVSLYDKKLSIYNDIGKTMLTIELKGDDVITIFNGKTFYRNDTTNTFNPWEFSNNPFYFTLIFDCIKADERYYTVIVDQSIGLTGKIKKSDIHFSFKTSEKFIAEATDVYGFDFDRSTNPLRKSPKDKGKIIQHELETEYKIWKAYRVATQGEWLKIKTIEGETGWVRWKKGKQMLIRLYYSC